MECREAAQQLPAYVDYPTGPLSVRNARALEAHLLTCASCRRELIRYQELQESLASLASKTVEPPAWLSAALLDAVPGRAARRVRISRLSRRMEHLPIPQELTDFRVAAAGGALLVAGLAAGALALGRGRRRRRSLPAGIRVAPA